MISPFVQILILIVHLITNSYQAKDTCNGSCLTKTYDYQDLASITFTAKQEDGINYFTIILTGYNIEENEYQQVTVVIDGNPEMNSYSCERNTSGVTASYYTNTNVQHTAGSSLYRDNTLYCFWTMSRASFYWPKRSDGSLLDLEIDSDHEIRMYLAKEDLRFLVTESTKDLPIYQMNFLKCCHAVYGNDKFQLFLRQTDNSNEFTLQFVNISSSKSSYVGVFLTASDTSEMNSLWYVPKQMLTVELQMKYVGLISLQSQLLYNYSWSPGIFTWSLPIVIKGFAEDYDTRNRIYDLKIPIDGHYVYTKSGITLTSSCSTQIPSTFFVFSVFLFHQIIY